MSLSDKRAVAMVIGCILHSPNILGATNDFPLGVEDFDEKFHKIIFGAVHNLYQNGASTINALTVDNYLCNYDLQYQVFQSNDGQEYLENAYEMAELENFEYYYARLKKFSALRQLEKKGFDVKRIYDSSIVSPREQEKMQEKFDAFSLAEIFDVIEKDFVVTKDKFVGNAGGAGQKASEGIAELVEKLKQSAEIGVPMQGNITNAVVRGARLRKLYMRSGASGTGKSRLAIGNAMSIATGTYYDLRERKWISNNVHEPTLFITTELDIDEVQTPMLAYLSGVPEESILNGVYRDNQEARIKQSVEIIENAPIWIEFLPNYSLTDVANIVRKYVVMHGVKYVFFDYLHSTVKMFQDLMEQSRGIKLREDSILSMFAAGLKDLANELDVFIHTATQLNRSHATAKPGEINETMLRGAMALADKLDVGSISLSPSKEDLDMLRPTIQAMKIPEPNIVTTFYKVRRSRWKGAKIWGTIDLDTCRMIDHFATDEHYNILAIQPLEIHKEMMEEETAEEEPIIPTKKNLQEELFDLLKY